MNQERAVSDVLQDILRNLQEIVRSEVRLARAGIRDDASRRRRRRSGSSRGPSAR